MNCRPVMRAIFNSDESTEGSDVLTGINALIIISSSINGQIHYDSINVWGAVCEKTKQTVKVEVVQLGSR